jgi:GxxExxY protein
MAEFNPIPDETERVVTNVIDAAFKVHKALGPGLIESVYSACLSYEFSQRHIPFETQIVLPVVYEGVRLATGLRPDFVVANVVMLEVKAVQEMSPLFDAQILTYLKLSGMRVGMLVNFNVALFREGVKRFVV